MEGTAITWSNLRQRRRRSGPKFPGRPRHNLVRRQDPAPPAAPPAEEAEGGEADGEQEEGDGDQEEEEGEEEGEKAEPASQEEEEEEAEAESESDAEDPAGASSESESDAAPPGQQADSSDSEQEQPPPAVAPPPPAATPAPPPGVQPPPPPPPPPPAASSLPPPAAQGSLVETQAPAQPPVAVLNPSRPSDLPASIPPARGFITLVPGAPAPLSPPPPPPQEAPARQPRPPPAATPSSPPVTEPQGPPPARQSSAPPPPPPPPPPPAEQPPTPPAAETSSTNPLPPPTVENAASGTPRPGLLPPNSQVEATNGPISATPAPAEGIDRGLAVGIAFAVVAIVALLIGLAIFGVKRHKRKSKVVGVAANRSQNPDDDDGGGGGNAFFPRESAILRQPKRDTREVERAIFATFRQTQIANRTTREMEAQMVARFRTERDTTTSPPNPPTAMAVPDAAAAVAAGDFNARNTQTESFYYEKSIDEPAMPAPLRISASRSQRRPATQSIPGAPPYPVSTYDMYRDVGRGPGYRESIDIGFQPYNPDSYYHFPPQPGGLPRAERGADGRFAPGTRY
ncbi:hypothetical protein CTA1_8786 [Colletotrichum tanaceti]|uniref:Uncharacterized protein n=1 Tax=Colletotrichum tanaceti TaxID=1306861 RepID=A0A4U6XBL1_9PEZI|nr:hypothetical protein CTA1_8786 [Colletotrichum tanaceti]